VMDGAYPRERIIACMKDLSRFLPLYNKAAEQTGGYRFSSGWVRQFGQLFEARDSGNS
jgi:hypothetical protein